MKRNFESGPIFDFGGPWWPGGPLSAYQTNTALPHTCGYVEKFQSSSINSFGCSVGTRSLEVH